jgi:hypothetical protein
VGRLHSTADAEEVVTRKIVSIKETGKMITDLMLGKILVIITLVLTLTSMSTYVDAAGSDISMKSKGGVLYPVTGDSTQDIFHTPPNITDTLRPGMLLGILPEDCKPASKGEIDDFYICNHGLFLKPATQGDRVAYEVIEID